MSLDEFAIIETYFKKNLQRADVELGVGDDCAVLCPPSGKRLLVSIDTLNEGIHFFSDTSADDIGYKAVAVSLSDIAAMGGEPLWALISLTLPGVSEPWLANFAKGMYTCLNQFNVALVGGNLTRGPLAITSQVIGAANNGEYLTRSGAKPGDLIYLTGYLGEGGIALALLKDRSQFPFFSEEQYENIISRLWRPMPRIAEGLLLSNIATAAIDISDGLDADLQHLLTASGVGATIYIESLPLRQYFNELPSKYRQMTLTAGDDYELCFTVPVDALSKLKAISKETGCLMTCIGKVEDQSGLRIVDLDGSLLKVADEGYKHFGT